MYYRPMRRFEGGKGRFWEIRRDGKAVHTRTGKIGTVGKPAAPKRLASVEKAQAEVEKRVGEQRAKGCVVVFRELPPEPATPEVKPTTSDIKPATPEVVDPAGHSPQAQAAVARVRDEKSLASFEPIFANVEYWKKLGEEFQQPLIVTGTVLFTPQSKSGMVSQTRETYDNLGRRVVMPTRVFMERKGYILRPKFIFIDGRTGTRIYSESFREERLYPSQQNVPALSSYFELMDDVIPRFLNVLSTQKVRGTRVLLK